MQSLMPPLADDLPILIPGSIYHDQITHRPLRIKIRQPPIGMKWHCIKEHGMFIFETEPTNVSGIACTHAGSGAVVIYDGLPDKDGIFEDSINAHLWVPKDPTPEERAAAEERYAEEYYNRNGRDVYYANPCVMGMWMFNGGLNRGFTVLSKGDNPTTAPVLSITWHVERKR
jgi:hypothetical protein